MLKTRIKATGIVAANGTEQAQHIDYYRKVLLRKKLLTMALPPAQGAIYVPFIGDGDLAFELYQGRKIYGADLDPKRVATASKRLKGSTVIVSDCDGWPFPEVKDMFSVADFDSYVDPYESFRAFWPKANKARRMVLFFTDGHRMPLVFVGHWHKPNGTIEQIDDPPLKKKIYSSYFPKHILPWFTDYIGPKWRIIRKMFYTRMNRMLYWGVVIERAR